MNTLDLIKDITKYPFHADQYINEVYPKKQIFLHHTAGNANPKATFSGWESNPERIAVCVTIGGLPDSTNTWKDGEIVQGFSSNLYAYHLGLKESTFQKFNIPYQSIDKISIGIELCNWGQLTYKEDKFYNYLNKVVPSEQVCELATPYKGFKFFHAYTDAQIISVEKLLRYWGGFYKIPLTYKEDIWDVTPRALKGEPGVYTHNSVRYDKWDVSPQPKLITMLKSL